MADPFLQRYEPADPPDDPDLLKTWLMEEFTKIAGFVNGVYDGHLERTDAEPEKPRDGMLRYADGTNWDPGEGEGIYAYYGGQWNKLQDAKELAAVQHPQVLCSFDNAGTIKKSHGVSSVDDDGTGDFGVNYSLTFAGEAILHATTLSNTGAETFAHVEAWGFSAADIDVVDDAGNLRDPLRVYFSAHGEV